MTRELAIETLSKDFLLNVDMLECIRRDSAELMVVSNKGVLLCDKISGAYMMSTEDMKIAEIMISKIPKDVEMIVGHQEVYYDLLMKKFKCREKMVCHQTLYNKGKLLKIPTCSAEITILTEEHIRIIMENYSGADLASEEYIKERIATKTMFGAFIDSKLCGFIGTHEEGSMGILEVLPAFRGLGIATVLQAVATNDALINNRYPYGQVKIGNEPSMNLQRKLGFEISANTIYWLFK